MIELRIKELAFERGVTLSFIQRNTTMPMSTARRYFYNSKTGLKRDAGTLAEVRLEHIEAISKLLGVEPSELFVRR